MAIDQVTVFLENRPGSLAEFLACLAEEGIDLRAYSMAETPDFGIMRMIVPDAGTAVEAVKRRGFIAEKTPVTGIVVPDEIGSTVSTIKLLGDAGINIEYTYAFAMPAGSASAGTAFVLLRVDDNARAEKILSEAGVRLAAHKEVF